MRIPETVVMGIGATLCIDVWALLLRTAFDVRSLNYCLLGRWLLHMPDGKFMHESIAASVMKSHECKVGWVSHYGIGVAFALLFTGLTPDEWLARPTLPTALAFGVVTVLVPFFTIQPAFGLGVASSRTRNRAVARLKSLTTHTIFGAGLYVSAYVLNAIR